MGNLRLTRGVLFFTTILSILNPGMIYAASGAGGGGCAGAFTADALPAVAIDPSTKPTVPLKDLDERIKERSAGEGGTSAYAQRFANKLFPSMHGSGHRWPLKSLEPIFNQGLLNYYFELYTGFNPNPEAPRMAPLAGGAFLPSTHRPMDVSGSVERNLNALKARGINFVGQEYPVLHWFDAAIIALRQNPMLTQIGTVFQKQKVRAEKLTELMEKGDAKAGASLAEESAHLHKIQTVIARWVQQVARCLVEELRHTAAAGAIDADHNAFIQSLSHVHPTFLNDPYWAQTMQVYVIYDLGEDFVELTDPSIGKILAPRNYYTMAAPEKASFLHQGDLHSRVYDRVYDEYRHSSFVPTITPADVDAYIAKTRATADRGTQLSDPDYVEAHLDDISKNPEEYSWLAKILKPQERLTSLDREIRAFKNDKEHKESIEKARRENLVKVVAKMRAASGGAAASAGAGASS